MEKLKNKKTRTAVIALATALVLALGGTMAWLVSADGTVTNVFDPNRVKVEITETGTDENGVNDNFDIIPGTEQAKDPKISATADCPAYVYAIVKDNTHDLVDYEIAEGWTEATGLTKVVTGKDKDGNEISIDPTAEGVKVYYREVSGTEEVFEHGPWSVLKDDKVSYSGDLTNEDMYNADGTPKYDDISLVFSAYAVQKTPFNDPAKAWNQEQEDPTVAVTGVTVTPETLSMKVGDADQQLTAAVAPEDATNKNVTWTSSDETIATVDETGNVHAVAEGTATITATTEDGSKTDTCEVNVTTDPVPLVETVTISEPREDDRDQLRFEVGDTRLLIADVYPDEASHSVTWESSDESVATVDAAGVVTAISPGEADITATATDGSGASGMYTVYVYEKTDLTGAIFTIDDYDDDNGNCIETYSWNLEDIDGGSVNATFGVSAAEPIKFLFRVGGASHAEDEYAIETYLQDEDGHRTVVSDSRNGDILQIDNPDLWADLSGYNADYFATHPIIVQIYDNSDGGAIARFKVYLTYQW